MFSSIKMHYNVLMFYNTPRRLVTGGCNSNSNSNVFCIQALVPSKTMFFGALFQPSTSK